MTKRLKSSLLIVNFPIIFILIATIFIVIITSGSHVNGSNVTFPVLPRPLEVIPEAFHDQVNATLQFLRRLNARGIREVTLANPVYGDPTWKSAENVNKNILITARDYERLGFYQFNSTDGFGFHTAPKQLHFIPEMGMTENIRPNFLYIQGVGMFSLFGIVGMVVTLLFFCTPVCITNCWSRCCCFCCCCLGTLQERDKDARMKNFKKWESRRRGKMITIRTCRGLVVGWVAIAVGCMIAYSIFAYQLNLDVSVSLDDFVAGGGRIESMGQNLSFILLGVNDKSEILSAKLDDYQSNTDNVIPNSTEIEDAQLCLDEAFENMPSPVRMGEAIDTTFDYIEIELLVSSTLPPDIDSTKQSMQDLEDVHLVNVRDTANQVHSMIGYRQTIYGAPATDMNAAKGILESNPSLAQIELSSRDVKDHTVNGGASRDNLVNITSAMQSIAEGRTTEETIGEIISRLDSLKISVEELKTGSSAAFATLKSALDSWKSAWENEDVGTKLGIWKEQVEGIDRVITRSAFTVTMETAIADYESERSRAEQSLLEVDLDLTLLQDKANGIPSLSPVQEELDKKDAALDLGECLSEVNQTIHNIDNNVLLLPNDTKAMADQVTDIEQFFGSMNFTGLTTLIEQLDLIKEELVPQIANAQEKARLTELAGLIPGSTQFTQHNNEASDIVREEVDDLESCSPGHCMQWTGSNGAGTKLKGMIQAFEQLNPANFEPYVSELESAIEQFDTGKIDQVRTELGALNPDDQCDQSLCNEFSSKAKDLADHLDDSNLVALLNEFDAEAFEKSSSLVKSPSMVDDTGISGVTLKDMMDNLVGFQDAALEMVKLETAAGAAIDQMYGVNQVGSPSLDGLKAVVEALNDGLKSAGSRDDINAQLEEMREQIDGVRADSISRIFDNLDSALTAFRLGDTFDSVRDTLEQLNDFTDAIINNSIVISEWREFGLDALYTADGIRVFLLAFITVLFTVPIPFIALCAVCCVRKPCSLMCLATLYVIVGFLCFAVVALFVPYNVAMADNCPDFERISVDALLTVSPAAADIVIYQNVTLGKDSEPVILEMWPIESAEYYLVNCSGEDVLGEFFIELGEAVQMEVEEVFYQLENSSLPDGFAIHPKVISFIESIQYDISDMTGLMAEVTDVFSCPAINSVYQSFKKIPCETYQYLFINFWVMSTILGVFALVSALFLNCVYCTLICSWTDPRKVSKILEDDEEEEELETNYSSSSYSSSSSSSSDD